MGTTERPMRADARRNRDAIVAVAKVHVRRNGVGTSLEAIAREAGVGAGTMYRHFPERGDLLAAVLHAEDDRLEAAAADCQSSPGDARARLELWLHEVEDYLATYQGLSAPLIQALDGGETTALTAACQTLIRLTDGLLRHAQAAELARTEVTASELVHCCAMLAWLRSVTPEGAPEHAGVRAVLRHGYARGTR